MNDLNWATLVEDDVEIASGEDGLKFLRCPSDPELVLRFESREWEDFVRVARDGEFNPSIGG